MKFTQSRNSTRVAAAPARDVTNRIAILAINIHIAYIAIFVAHVKSRNAEPSERPRPSFVSPLRRSIFSRWRRARTVFALLLLGEGGSPPEAARRMRAAPP